MTLGDALKSARESARMSLEDLSAITSIRVGLLQEMERNEFAHCGGDTYARGHIRTISQKLGLESQPFLEMFEEEHSTAPSRIQESLAETNLAKVPHEAKRMSWKVPASISLLVIVVIGIVQIIITNTNQPVVVKPVVTASPTASAMESATPTASSSVSANAVTGSVTLVVSATRGSSQVDFVVDGEHVYKGPMVQGDTKTFTGKTSISIYFSNPAGLDVTLNGTALAPLGGENQEVRRTFRAQ